jgi:serine beta-lactamase-like protein LACTB
MPLTTLHGAQRIGVAAGVCVVIFGTALGFGTHSAVAERPQSAAAAAATAKPGGTPPAQAAAAGKMPELSAATITAIDVAAKSFLMASHSQGLSVAVVVPGYAAFSRGYGEADVATHRAATSETLFRLASVSKPLTATGAMQLVQAGKLDLDAPVQKYCAEFPEKPHVITTRELLAHLGGIRHYGDIPNEPEDHNAKHFSDPISGGITFFANDALVNVPGTTFHYSTMGYTLVGCAMEGASGGKYVAYMTKNVFAPAHMSHTVEDDSTATIPERTAFYTVKDGKAVPAPAMDPSYKVPGGGWLSSADDLVAYEEAMFRDLLVTRATRDTMWSPAKLVDGTFTHYGYGFDVQELYGLKVVWHNGGQEGTSTCIELAPDANTGVVVLANTDGVDVNGLAKGLMKIALAETHAKKN